eukprot:3848228-Prymnesium_polylepis.1
MRLSFGRAARSCLKWGKYYFADEKILENHGWSFDEGVALRYEVIEEKNVTRSDGTTRKYLRHDL